MSFYYRTNLTCSNPEIIASGSFFAQAIDSEIIGNNEDEIQYITYNDDLHDEILKLSKENPEVSFTAITWCDSEYYEQIVWTTIYSKGSYEEVSSVI